MPSLSKVLLAATAALVSAAVLMPAVGEAGRPGRNCDNNAQDPICRQIEKRREVNDRQRGITPACRAAANKYVLANQELGRSKADIGPWKKALKKAKTKAAKKKYAKGLKKAKARYKKAKKVNVAGLKAAADQACASAKVKPY
jgi:hypothetical protein